MKLREVESPLTLEMKRNQNTVKRMAKEFGIVARHEPVAPPVPTPASQPHNPVPYPFRFVYPEPDPLIVFVKKPENRRGFAYPSL